MNINGTWRDVFQIKRINNSYNVGTGPALNPSLRSSFIVKCDADLYYGGYITKWYFNNNNSIGNQHISLTIPSDYGFIKINNKSISCNFNTSNERFIIKVYTGDKVEMSITPQKIYEDGLFDGKSYNFININPIILCNYYYYTIT